MSKNFHQKVPLVCPSCQKGIKDGVTTFRGKHKCPHCGHLEKDIMSFTTDISINKSKKEEKKWLSPYDNCDVCNGAIKGKVKYFVDGKTKMGPWALMCPTCFESLGVGIGYGKGQKYDGTTAVLLDGGCNVEDL